MDTFRIPPPCSSSSSPPPPPSSSAATCCDAPRLPHNLRNPSSRTSGPKLQRLWLGSAMAALLALTLLAQTTTAMPNEWEEQRMCGRLLIQALKMVCNHQYVQPNRDNFYETAGMVLRARRATRSPAYVVKRRRQVAEAAGVGAARPAVMGRSRRGIIWECCTNKCSLNYIRNNYCAGAEGADEAQPAPPEFQLVDDERRRR